MPEPSNSNQPHKHPNPNKIHGPQSIQNFFEGQVLHVLTIDIGIVNPKVIGYVVDLVIAIGINPGTLRFTDESMPLRSIITLQSTLSKYDASARRSGLVKLGNIILANLCFNLRTSEISKTVISIGSNAFEEAAEIKYVENLNPDSELLAALAQDYQDIAQGVAQIGRELNLR